MKKLIISLFGFFVISPLTAQERWKYNDFTDGKKVAVDGITYIIENPLQHITGQLDEQMISIRRENEPSEQFDKFGEYPDGTFCNDPEECAGIIRHRQEIPLIIHAAWKKAFPKEERESHPEVLIFAFPILDLQGKIEALAFTVPVFREYAVEVDLVGGTLVVIYYLGPAVVLPIYARGGRGGLLRCEIRRSGMTGDVVAGHSDVDAVVSGD